MALPQSRVAAWVQSPALAHLIFGFIFLALGLFFVRAGFTPTHEVISWYGLTHYFYDSMTHGVIPFWNPYTQTGVPFYPCFQDMGLWEPSNYVFILLHKLTGWSTLTTFLFHYLFYYFLFIAGTYNTLRLVTQRNGASLLFSLVLLLSTFPVFMHQGVTLTPFYLLPFITYFLFKLFEETEVGKKGFYLFCVASLCAVSCLSYIPSYMAFYVLFFLILAFALKVASVKDILRLFNDRRGLFWACASAVVAILILAPVAALYFDMKSGNELFPYSRIELSNGFHLPKMFVSETGLNVFSREATTPVSITLANMIGLLLEPHLVPGLRLQPSEVILYVGILPLFCLAFLVFGKQEIRNRRAQLMVAMAIIAMLIMTNFKACIFCPLDSAQKFLVSVVPTLDKIEVFENFGTIFLFCLIAAASVGFVEAVRGRSRNLWLAALIFWTAKYASIIYWTFALRGMALSPEGYAQRLFLFSSYALAVLVCALAIMSYFLFVNTRLFASEAAVKRLRSISVVLLLWELAYFNLVHIEDRDYGDKNGRWVIGKQYYAALMRENLLPPKRETSFINFRKPYMSSDLYNFCGHEILGATKVAWPGLFNIFFGGRPVIDYGYSTQSYYSYLTNVRLANQLVTSSVVYPILNFFPVENAVFVPDERAAVASMNRLDLRRLGERIFIERKAQRLATPAENQDLPRLMSPENYLTLSREEFDKMRRLIGLRFPGYRGFKPQIEHFDPNRLSVAVEAPKDGYFYFGDGYSKHWRAFIDGRPAKIEKANVNFKAIFVSQGSHRIDFVYDLAYIRYAMVASILGSVASIVLGLLGFRYCWSGGMRNGQ